MQRCTWLTSHPSQVSEIRLGSRADSYYGGLLGRWRSTYRSLLAEPSLCFSEYLLKQYLQTKQKESLYKEMYEEAMEGIRKHLATASPVDNTVWTYELAPAMHPRTREL